MSLAILIIALDEEDYIFSSVISAAQTADTVFIVDGGSADRTVELIGAARSALANMDIDHKADIILSEDFPWANHFGIQRQNCLDLMRQTGEYDFWLRLDSDEVLPLDFRLRWLELETYFDENPKIQAARVRQLNLFPDYGHYVANIGGWETHPRLFRNDDNLRWNGQVHEFIVQMTRDGLEPIREDEIVNWSIPIIHRGWISRTRRNEREDLYMGIPGSGVTKRGDLTNRQYAIRELPLGIRFSLYKPEEREA